MTSEEPLREILRRVDTELEKGGWDQDPQLLTVFRTPVVAPGLLAEVYELRPFPQWEEVVFRVGHPPTAVAILAKVLGKAPRDLIEGSFEGAVALVFVTEAWMAWRWSKDEPVPSEHPDRIECRVLSVVMADGTADGLLHPRDGVPIESGEHQEITGVAVEALQDLAKATIGLSQL